MLLKLINKQSQVNDLLYCLALRNQFERRPALQLFQNKPDLSAKMFYINLSISSDDLLVNTGPEHAEDLVSVLGTK